MGNFKRDNRSGGRRDDRSFSGRNSRPSMHSAICDECKKNCEVPFKPTGDKPIFCSDCFRNKGNAGPRQFSGGDKKMYEAVCDKCKKNCEVPFKPTGDKPVYCSLCFGQGNKGKGSNQSNQQLEIINAKLDKILKALNPALLTDEKEKTISPKSKPALEKKKSKPTKPRPRVAEKPKKASKSKKIALPKKPKAKPKVKKKK